MSGEKVRKDGGQEPVVLTGSVWKDCDERCHSGRWVKVVDIDPAARKATCLVYLHDEGHIVEGRATKIRLDRFRPGSTGYRLVSAVGAYE